jgi:hypothetical protein
MQRLKSDVKEESTSIAKKHEKTLVRWQDENAYAPLFRRKPLRHQATLKCIRARVHRHTQRASIFA